MYSCPSGLLIKTTDGLLRAGAAAPPLALASTGTRRRHFLSSSRGNSGWKGRAGVRGFSQRDSCGGESRGYEGKWNENGDANGWSLPVAAVSALAFSIRRGDKSTKPEAPGVAKLSSGRGAGVMHYVGARRRAPVQCCGIVGYIGPNDAHPVLIEGVQILQNRGYDSCGITTIDASGTLRTTKYASKGSTSDCVDKVIDESPTVHGGHHIGIAHTRWATHGGKTDNNAHPHHDWKNRISLIHNGTIENYFPIKQELMAAGIPFRSDTDTEVIANLIGKLIDEGLEFEDACKEAVARLRGTWGLVIVHKDNPDRMVLARNGSPLLVGNTDDEVFVASEQLALARYTNQYLQLQDGEVIVATRGGIDHLCAGRQMLKIQNQQVDLSPDPYPHWTLKEISEQPQSLSRALNYGGRISPIDQRAVLGGLDENASNFSQVNNMILSGCGTSLYAASFGELLMQYLGAFENVRAVDASEISRESFPKDTSQSALILMSQSGETLDVIRACQVADSSGIRKLSVVNVVGSLLARMTNCGVYLNAGREVAVASTKAFTSQVTVLALIAAWFAQNQFQVERPDRLAELMSAVHRLPVLAGMTLQCQDKCKEIAQKIKNKESLFVLGKGFCHPVAMEGALKIKEVSYIHAEGYPGGALKHGPFALIDEEDRTPVILLVLADEHAPLMINAAEQVKARGAHVICITDDPTLVKNVADDIVIVPSNGPLTGLLCALPLQLIGYHAAIARGVDPDKPRGLAKTVTVW